MSVTDEIISLSGLMFAVTCQSEKRLSGVEWNTVSDKAERQSGKRLRISHAKVPHRFAYTFLLNLLRFFQELYGCMMVTGKMLS